MSSTDDEIWEEISPIIEKHTSRPAGPSQQISVSSTHSKEDTVRVGDINAYPKWCLTASTLSVMHMYSALTLFAAEVRNLRSHAPSKKRAQSRSGTTAAQSYADVLWRAAEDWIKSQNGEGSPAPKKSLPWTTMKDAITQTEEQTSDTALVAWAKEALAQAYQADSTAPPIDGTCPYLVSFVVECLERSIPTRLCFGADAAGNILRECMWDHHDAHGAHRHTAFDAKEPSCSLCLWVELYCAESMRWISVLPSLYRRADGSLNSVHFSWGSAYSIAVGSAASMRRKCEEESTTKAKKLKRTAPLQDELLEFSSDPIDLKLYATDVTPKYTSDLCRSYTSRKLKRVDVSLQDLGFSDSSDDEADTLDESNCIARFQKNRMDTLFVSVRAVQYTALCVDWDAFRAQSAENPAKMKKSVKSNKSKENSEFLAKIIYRAVDPSDRYLGSTAELERMHRMQVKMYAFPTSLQATKSHPVYVSQAFLRPRETIRIQVDGSGPPVYVTSTRPPPDFAWVNAIPRNTHAIAGVLKNAIVFFRGAILPIRASSEWLARNQLVPRREETPITIVHKKKCTLHEKGSKTNDKLSSKAKRAVCQCPAMYGRWQLEKYSFEKRERDTDAPLANGIPRNSYGDFDMLMPQVLYRLFRQHEDAMQRCENKAMLLHRFLTGDTTDAVANAQAHVLRIKSLKASWWAQSMLKFPHDSVVKVLQASKSLETHFACLQPVAGLMYVPFEGASRVVEAENAYRSQLASQRTQKRGKRCAPLSAETQSIDHATVLIGFDRITSSLYLPRKLGIVMRESDYRSIDFPKLYSRWVAYWAVCDRRAHREKIFVEWRRFFHFLAAREEVHCRYASGAKSL